MSESKIIRQQRIRTVILIIALFGIEIFVSSSPWKVITGFGILLIYIGSLIYQMKLHKIYRWRNSTMRGHSVDSLANMAIVVWSILAIFAIAFAIFSV